MNAPLRAGLADRIARLDWDQVTRNLDAFGAAHTAPLLSPEECHLIRSWYEDDDRFRSHVTMARHGFGQGEYKYFAYPLPQDIAALREGLYPHLAPLANKWSEALDGTQIFPPGHTDFLALCHAAGQTRPTPLLLRYREGDYNCLHQDLYGEHVFPLQAAILLSAPHEEFEGGEFVVTEQRPRMQSRAEVVSLKQGEAVVFAVSHRPKMGTKGTYRVNLRHGVSRLKSGERYTLGIIFHDAA